MSVVSCSKFADVGGGNIWKNGGGGEGGKEGGKWHLFFKDKKL